MGLLGQTHLTKSLSIVPYSDQILTYVFNYQSIEASSVFCSDQ